MIKRALDGRQYIPIAYDGRSIFHTSSATSVAALTTLCMQKPTQRILNVADPTPLSIVQIAHALQKTIGREITLRPFAGKPTGHVGSSPWSVPLPYTLNCSAAKALGWDGGAEYSEAVRDMAQWLVSFKDDPNWQRTFTSFANYPDHPFDYSAEDQWLLKLDKVQD